MGLNTIQKILGGKEIKPKTDEEIKKMNVWINQDRKKKEAINNINYTGSRYGNGASSSHKYSYGNGSSSSTTTNVSTSNNETTEYMTTNNNTDSNPSVNDNSTKIANGTTQVIDTGKENYSEPEVIIPETDYSNSETSVPITVNTESAISENIQNNYDDTGASTYSSTDSIIENISENPVEPISDYPDNGISDSGYSNNSGVVIPSNYRDGYAETYLTPELGRIQFNGHDETYYNLDMSGVVDIMRNSGFSEAEYPYGVREDGVKTLGSYIIVAADLNLHPRGSIIDTSLGKAIVCDTGTFTYSNAEQIDIAVTW